MTLKGIQNLAHTVEEAVNAHKVVKNFNAQNQFKTRFHSDLNQLRMAATREAVPSSAITPITHLVASAAVAGIIFLALSQVTGQAGSSAGGFVSFITAMLMMIGPIKQLTTVNMVMQRSLSACESFFELIDCEGESDLGTIELSNVSGDIRFEDVSFIYPHASRQALSKVSFIVKAGSTVALVGASGGGKSTISSLLPRFYNPSFGQILIDGVDISSVKLFSLRQSISLVTQDIVLFNDSVHANIAFGSSIHSSKEQVILAAKAAYAWDFICQLPNGLDTLIGEDGTKLSGGQRQRIAIARAILKNAPILILDEATSALDTESERHVQLALATLMKGRTTLVIAHRLSTIEHADQILVLDQGRIVERGTHNELLTNGGYYTNLIKMQTGGLG
jgi:subfamily B ATP-binding cassette protein MsbA